MTDAADDQRELTVHLWYPTPATAEAGADAAPYVPDLADLGRVLEGRAREAFGLVRTHARPGAAPAPEPARFPLLILSPGNDMLASQYSFLVEELVSHGYVVAALDHPYDARAVLLSDGTAVAHAASRWPAPPPPDASGRPLPDSPHARFYQERVGVRADDARLVLQRLAEGAVTAGGLDLGNRVDLARVGFLGHSVGGVAAGEVCRREPRIKACVNLDGESPGGPYYLAPDGTTFTQPYLMLTKPIAIPDDQLARWGLDRQTWQARLSERTEQFFGSLRGGSHRVVLDGASHSSFSDDPFVFATLSGDAGAAGHLARMGLIRQLLRAFFGHHLQGEPAATLDATFHQPSVTAETWPPR